MSEEDNIEAGNRGDALLGMAEDLMELRPDEDHFTPLDDLARRRLVEGVLDRVEPAGEDAPRGRRRGPMIAAAVVAFLALSGALAAAYLSRGGASSIEPAVGTGVDRPGEGRLLLAEGRVVLRGREVVGLDARIASGDEIGTPEGRAVLSLPTGVRILLENGTKIRVNRLDGESIELHLETGEILASVSPRREGPELSIRTEAGRVVVTGTIFAVRTGAETKVEVFRGSVRVEGDGRTPRSVRASTFALLGEEVEGEVSPEREAEVTLTGEALDLLAGDDAVAVTISSIPPAASVRLGGIDLGRTPLAANVRPGHRDLEISLRGHSSVRERMRLVPGFPVERAFELGPEAVSPEPEPEAPRDSPVAARSRSSADRRSAEVKSPAELLREAQDLRAAKNWTLAARAFRRLLEAHPISPEARAATVSLANIEARQLGRPRVALELFDRYLRDGGPLSPEASWGRIGALEALGREAEAISALRGFIARYPDSMRRGAAEARLGSLVGDPTP